MIFFPFLLPFILPSIFFLLIFPSFFISSLLLHPLCLPFISFLFLESCLYCLPFSAHFCHSRILFSRLSCFTFALHFHPLFRLFSFPQTVCFFLPPPASILLVTLPFSPFLPVFLPSLLPLHRSSLTSITVRATVDKPLKSQFLSCDDTSLMTLTHRVCVCVCLCTLTCLACVSSHSFSSSLCEWVRSCQTYWWRGGNICMPWVQNEPQMAVKFLALHSSLCYNALHLRVHC